VKPSDYDIDVISPELVKGMFEKFENPNVSEDIIRDGEKVIFKSNKPGGFFAAFPEFAELAGRWEKELGREVDFKLKLEPTPVSDLPEYKDPGAGPIVLFRKTAT
jgi:hypothetical protein